MLRGAGGAPILGYTDAPAMRSPLVTAALVGALSMLLAAVADPATVERGTEHAGRYWDGLLGGYVEVQRVKAVETMERGEHEAALASLHELAEGGDAEAARIVADCYRTGQCGVPADRRAAERWGRRAGDGQAARAE